MSKQTGLRSRHSSEERKQEEGIATYEGESAFTTSPAIEEHDEQCNPQQCMTKYFCQSQKLEEQARLSALDPNAGFFVRHRKKFAIGIPVTVVWIVWFTLSAHYNLWYFFDDQVGSIKRFYMSITMIFGSMVAGATSEGGASVAFPVMTLGFGIKPAVARDFSFMIQTVGMNAAAFTILTMKVKVEKTALLFSTLGGMAGIMIGLDFIAPKLPPPFAKMYFVSIWFSFAVSLFWLNRNFGRKVYDEVQDLNAWKRGCLFCFGFVGGVLSSIAGSGIDICTFACLTLLFRVTERVATPTSVILMAVNTSVGFFWRAVSPNSNGIEPDAWGFLYVCAPIVVVGAPLGSIVGSRFHRLVLAACVYITDTVQLIGAIVIVPQSIPLTLSSLGFMGAGGIIFTLMSNRGLKYLGEWKLMEDGAAPKDGEDEALKGGKAEEVAMTQM